MPVPSCPTHTATPSIKHRHVQELLVQTLSKPVPLPVSSPPPPAGDETQVLRNARSHGGQGREPAQKAGSPAASPRASCRPRGGMKGHLESQRLAKSTSCEGGGKAPVLLRQSWCQEWGRHGVVAPPAAPGTAGRLVSAALQAAGPSALPSRQRLSPDNAVCSVGLRSRP